MGLGFLVPAFLAGLAALVVPVLIHLRHREWEKPRRFPSLMFLRRIPIRTARRRRITDWLLLLVRAAAIAVLVAAFARPFFRANPAAVGNTPARAVALLLDRSLSMSHREVWPAALDSARRVVQALGPADRVAVIRFDDRAEVAQPLTSDRAAALAAIASTRPGSHGTRYAAALRAGRQALAEGQRDRGTEGLRAAERGEIIVITDVQRSGLGSGGTGGPAGLELPAGVEVRVLPVAPRNRGNATVLGAEVQRTPASGDRSELLVAARVSGRELGSQRRVRLSLTVEGRPAGSREVALPPDGVITVSFDRVPLGPGRARAVLALEGNPDPLPGDDTLRLVVPPEAGLRVVLVVPAGARADETLFLERALAIGRDPRFVVERKQVLEPAALRTAAVVILFDVAPTSGALDQWVRNGGGLIVAAGSRLGRRPVTLLAGTVQGMAERLDDRGGSFGDVSLEHPVFAPFRAAGGESGGLGNARFLRYPRVVPLDDSRVIARLDDGNPALVERSHGSGRVLLVTAPLDNLTGDFPLQPAYLPFLRRLASHAAGHQVAPQWRLAGETGIVPQTIQDAVVATPGGALLRPAADSGPRAVPLDEAGYYQTYSGRAAGEPLEVVAVNPPPPESDLTPADPRELLIGVRQDSSAAAAQAALAPAERESRQSVWRWLVMLAAVLLVLEAVVANRGWRGTASFVLPSPASPERSSS